MPDRNNDKPSTTAVPDRDNDKPSTTAVPNEFKNVNCQRCGSPIQVDCRSLTHCACCLESDSCGELSDMNVDIQGSESFQLGFDEPSDGLPVQLIPLYMFRQTINA